MISWQAPSMPVRIVLVELAALEVGARGGELHHRERLDQVGIEAQLHAGDVEVLEAARGLDAVVGVGRHGLVAEQIVFETCRLIGHRNDSSGETRAGTARAKVARLMSISHATTVTAAQVRDV